MLYKKYVKYLRGNDIITGEATPYYLFHPHVPERIFSIIPGIKLIVLLRNPIDRAYSHYYHQVTHKRETLSFEEAIKKEYDRLNGEDEKMMKNKDYLSYNHAHFSYLSRGIYVDQLKRWFSIFPKNQILVLKSEDFFEDTSRIYNEVLSFL